MLSLDEHFLLPEESYIRQAFHLAFPSELAEDRRFLIVLDAYFDDSGTHDGSPVVSVAGYLGLPAKWVSFETEWKLAMSEFGLNHFGMADYSNRAKPYCYWTEEERYARLERLMKISNAYALGSVGIAVPTESFNRVMSEKAKRISGGPYGLAATACFLRVANLVKSLSSEAWVAYIFESGTRGAGEVLKVFQENERDESQKHELRLLSLRFENKRQFVPLQAADIVAYETYRQLPKQLGTDPRPPRFPILNQLLTIPKDWGYLEEEELRKWNEVISQKEES